MKTCIRTTATTKQNHKKRKKKKREKEGKKKGKREKGAGEGRDQSCSHQVWEEMRDFDQAGLLIALGTRVN